VITEEEKYRAEVFKIVGIALLMPIGKAVLSPIVLITEIGVINFILYFIASLLSLFVGITFIDKGRGILSYRFGRKE